MTPLLIIATLFAVASSRPVPAQTSTVVPADRTQVVLIKPVITCDDDGGNPAPHVLPKDLLDDLKEFPDVEFLFLEPIRWHHGSLRRGEGDLQKILDDGLQQRILCRDQRVLSLLFVSDANVDRSTVVLAGKERNVIVVALPSTGQENGNLAPQEQVIREKVADQIKLALQVSDSKAAQASAVIDRIEFHSIESGQQLLIDESWEPYLEAATDDFVRFSIGLDKDDPIPQVAEARRTLVAQRYAEKVLAFSQAEQALLRERIQRLASLTGRDWPSVSRMPWHFIKVDSSFCSGFPHTRGLAIVIPEQALQMMQFSEPGGLSLLLHEKLHVLQRINPDRFNALYQSYGFEKVKMDAGELQRIGVAQNPDAFQLEWALRMNDQMSSMVMVFATDEQPKLRFDMQYRRLNARPDGRYVFGEIIQMDSNFRQWQSGFGMNMGTEHPNETSAYLSGPLLQIDYLSPNRPRPVGDTKADADQSNAINRLEQTRNAFRSIMRVD